MMIDRGFSISGRPSEQQCLTEILDHCPSLTVIRHVDVFRVCNPSVGIDKEVDLGTLLRSVVEEARGTDWTSTVMPFARPAAGNRGMQADIDFVLVVQIRQIRLGQQARWKDLASHYGFTDEELDFIINYDVKYRLGQENLAGGDD